MSLSLSMRRRLLALAIAAPSALAIGLGSKLMHGPDWLVFGGITLAVLALAVLLILADGIFAQAQHELAQPDADDSPLPECFT